MATPSDRARQRTVTATNDQARVTSESIYRYLSTAEPPSLILGPLRRVSPDDPSAVVEVVAEGARDASA